MHRIAFQKPLYIDKGLVRRLIRLDDPQHDAVGTLDDRRRRYDAHHAEQRHQLHEVCRLCAAADIRVGIELGRLQNEVPVQILASGDVVCPLLRPELAALGQQGRYQGGQTANCRSGQRCEC